MNIPHNVLINVTSEDISRGSKCSGRHCPIAIAIQRSLPGLDEVVVGFSFGTLGCLKQFWVIKLPRAASNFISLFDGGVDPDDLQPFSFFLAVQEEITEDFRGEFLGPQS